MSSNERRLRKNGNLNSRGFPSSAVSLLFVFWHMPLYPLHSVYLVVFCATPHFNDSSAFSVLVAGFHALGQGQRQQGRLVFSTDQKHSPKFHREPQDQAQRCHAHAEGADTPKLPGEGFAVVGPSATRGSGMICRTPFLFRPFFIVHFSSGC